MNIWNKCNLYVFSFFVVSQLFVSVLHAQVTVGSLTTPMEGALLDIKTVDASDVENTAQGVLMPRVELVDRGELLPMLENNVTYTTGTAAQKKQLKADHKGLAVYNLTKNAAFSEGIYIWDGQRWVANTVNKVVQGDAQSNSFMVPPATGVYIPLKKAFDVWSSYKVPKGNSLTILGNEYLDGLNTLIAMNGGWGNVKAYLLWQDKPGLVCNASPDPETLNELPLIGADENANILVLSNGSVGGNAVIAFASKNGTNPPVVLWSWHVWFTDYNPNLDASGNPQIIDTYGKRTALNGNVHRHNNETGLGGDYVFMDRNLGARTNLPVDDNTELLYQWGRKDPFPGMRDRQNPTIAHPIYDAANELVEYDVENDPVPTNPGIAKMKTNLIPSEDNRKNNLANSIMSPKVFFTTASTTVTDWYTTETNSSYQNNYLWGTADEKSPFDPCPKGWRVPYQTNTYSPWYFGISDGTNVGSQYGVTWNKGVHFTGNSAYDMGYYPNTGFRDNAGNFYDIWDNGYVWSATSDVSLGTDAGKSYNFQYGHDGNPSDITIKTSSQFGRIYGFAVRCVAE